MNTFFKPKLFTLLKAGIDKKTIWQDVMAGVVVGIVALPLAIAFAVASGVSPEKGIITAIVAGFIISLLGGSRVQIGGPTGAFIVIVYGIVQQYGIDGLIISTMLAGLILIIFGVLKLGTLLKYFPHPLIVGFTGGIAVVIFSTQVKDALGLDIARVPAEFIGKWHIYFTHLNSVNPFALAITAATILIVVFSKKIFGRIPGSFIAILLSTLAVQLLHLPVTTIASFFGEIPSTFTFNFPHVGLSQLPTYLVPALTIALLGGIESLLSAVVADGMIGGKHRSNTELIAQGIANIVTPLFGGIPATGAIARTATNVKNGGRTPLAGISHSITLLLIMLFFGKWARLIPMSCLAGILIVAAYTMSEWRSFISILRGSLFDSIVMLTTFFLTVLLDLTIAIEVGVVLSALLFMKRMSDFSEKQIERAVDSDVIDDYSNIPDDISIYEISGPLFFASARTYSQVIENIGLKSKIMIIRMRHVSFVDHTGLHNLRDTVRILKHHGVLVVLSGVNKEVMKDFDREFISDIIDRSNIFGSFEKALSHAKRMLKETEHSDKS
ncbi:MAG: STAS domain-containing protein [Candidatus Marinimicrobia bacterium]|nr:STAS domain-containing protein [Candidatus Neomarinimicrobiota bacterium]